VHLAAADGAALHGREGVAAALLRLCASGERNVKRVSGKK
jgi:hypothetical protein